MKKFLTIAAFAALTLVSCNKGFSTDDATSGNTDGLVFNEIDAQNKGIEFYNKGTKTVSLSGVSIVKYDSTKEGGKSTTWTGVSGMELAPGAWMYIESSDLGDENEKGDPNYQYQSPNHIFKGGLSGKKNVKLELCDVNGKVIDTFIRGTEGLGWNKVDTYNNVKTSSFSRVPDGTGEWVYADPSLGKANNEKTGDIEQEPKAE